MSDLEERVAALEAALATLMHKLLARGDITINDARAVHGLPAFPGGEPGTATEPGFMARTRTGHIDGSTHTVRLTHEPAGITVAAPDRPEAIIKLRKALAARARRDYDLQEAARRQQRQRDRPA